MRFAAVLIAVAAWLLAASATAHAAPTTITFDEGSSGGDLLTTQYAAAGLTFVADQDCRRSAMLFNNEPFARSGSRVAIAACPGFEGGMDWSDAIAGTFTSGQRTVTVMARIYRYTGSSNVSRAVTLRARTATGDVRTASATVTSDGWTPLTVTMPQNALTSFEIGYDSPDYEFPLTIDDLSFSRDVTPPEIYVVGPGEDAVYAKDERVRAEYYCYDDESGIATPDGCEGTTVYGYNVDTSTLGEHEFVVEARDNAGNTSTKTVKYTVVETKISLSPACDASGTEGNYKITVSGFGVDPGRRGVLRFSGDGPDVWEHPDDIVAAADGTFTVDIEPPRQVDGFYDVTFHYRIPYDEYPYGGSVGPVIASAVFAVPCPTLEVEPQCGPAATGAPGFYTLRLVGRGFPPESDATFAFAGAQAGETVVDDRGGFTATITPPLHPAGTYDVTATASTRTEEPFIPTYVPPRPPPGANFDVVAKTTFKVPCEAPPPPRATPAISVDPTCGPAGSSELRVTGAGFDGVERAVELLFDGEWAGSAQVASDGTFDATVSVADVQPRLHTVSVRYDDGDGMELAKADFVVPCEPEVSVTPDCGQAQLPHGSARPYTIEVSGRGFVPPGTASVSFNGAVVRSDVAVAEDGTVSAPIEVEALPTGRYVVRVEQQVPVSGGHVKPHVAVTDFTVPCGEVAVTPGCDVPLASRRGGELYRLSVRGKSFATGSALALTFENEVGVALATHLAKPKKNGKLATTFEVPRQRDGRYVVRATILRRGEPTASFVASVLDVPCRKPTIEVDPPLGRPGFLTTVKGRKFPPNARIRLAWSTGALGSTRVRTDANGRFQARMLVFMHDLLGPRLLTARTETGYSKASADYLVVPGSQQPSGFLVRR